MMLILSSSMASRPVYPSGVDNVSPLTSFVSYGTVSSWATMFRVTSFMSTTTRRQEQMNQLDRVYRRRIGVLLSLFTLVITTVGQAAGNPNFVVILTDDQGWGDLGLNGNVDIATPNIDTLAREGTRFDRFYVCPVCSPTRAEFLTGRYHPRCGVYSTSAGGERMDLDEKTIADTFKAAGYATGAFGKWHNGMQYPYHPNGRGFEEYYGFCSGHWGNYYDPMLERNGRIVEGNGYVTDDFTDNAMSFIRGSVK